MEESGRKTTSHDLDDFDDAELEELYTWVDSIQLSRAKRNIARDFSDGVLVAEIVKSHFPQLVDLHNYTGANSASKKKDNWYYLNRKVFSKLNFELAEDVINDLVNCTSGVVEKVLMMIRIKVNRAEWELKKRPSLLDSARKDSDKPEADQNMAYQSRTDKVSNKMTKASFLQAKGSPQNKGPELNPGSYVPKKLVRSVAESDMVPRILLEEKQQEYLARDETIKILQAKIQRLEHLIHLKDIRIDDLQCRLEKVRPTGNKI
ncbi:hypothetical protein ScPMuIL_005732 [Solemya velum]